MPLINIRACRVVGVAAALGAATLSLTAMAHAQPGPVAPPVDPLVQCESPEFGGVFVPVTATHSECQYIVAGNFYYDNYDEGVYSGTLVYRDGEKVPTERPQMPETFTMPGGVPLLVPFAGAQ